MTGPAGDGLAGGLLLHTAERADVLVDALAQVLALPLGDPFAREVVAVPTRGVERWVAQRLSHTLGTGGTGDVDGVCANVAFDPPSRLVASALSAVLGVRREDDPWRRDRLSWAILQVMDASAGEAWCGPLSRHLGLTDDDGLPHGRPTPDRAMLLGDLEPVELHHRRDRRMQVAQHLAGLFTSYGAQRPELLLAWASNRARDADQNGAGGELPTDLAWQPELWRRVRTLLGVPSPAERLADAVEALRQDPALVDLPERISVFGATRLPADEVAVLRALARHRAVHVWLPHPSPVVWQRVAHALQAETPTGRTGHPPRPRRSAVVPADHPLLASMARDALELQTRLQPLAASVTHHPSSPSGPSGPGDTEVIGDPGGAGERDRTLLSTLQARLAADDVTSPPAVLPSPSRSGRDDRSVQVHACHGRARQVEVLREVLLGLFADDPTLEPRDVVVMCPDVETFAPLVAATFGLGAPTAHTAGAASAAGAAHGTTAHGPAASTTGASPGPGPAEHAHPGLSLRVSLADRSLRQTNPLLSLLSAVLDLADSRVTATAVIDLAGSPPVRTRFGWKDDDLEHLRSWCIDAGVRWGEDEARRRRYGLAGVGQGTWRNAVDRLLLGVAMADEDNRFIATVLPLDDVDSNHVDLAGRFGEFIDRLATVLAALDGRRPADAWFDALEDALDLLTAAPAGESWQEVEARAVLADARRSAHADVLAGVELSVADLRAVLRSRLRGRPTRAGFRTGSLTVCSLEPMRSVPHRVICLLGMDDGEFPRGRGADGDDVLQREPLVGERDRRSEDRQLFLDAVVAARDHLVVLYCGADERTGASRPPAVPVSELLDALDASATLGGLPAREHVLTGHPLQTFDPRNFEDGALGAPGPFSFDRLAYRAALTARVARSPVPAFLGEPLPPFPRGSGTGDAGVDGAIALPSLVRGLEHPVQHLVRTRLGASLPRDEDDVLDRLPLELGPLEGWQVGDRLLTAALAGIEPRTAMGAEIRRGLAPPGALGLSRIRAVGENVDPIARAVLPLAQQPAEALDILVELRAGDGSSRLITGTVPGIHRGPQDVVLRAVYAKLGPKYRLRAWLHVLCAAAAYPDRRFRAVIVGRGMGRRPMAARSELEAPPAPEALSLLADLVDLYDLSLREPLPLLPGVSAAYVRARLGGEDERAALEAARREFDTGFETDEYHALVWGEDAGFDAILGTPTAEDLRAAPGEGTRFGALARRLWEPILGIEIRGAG